MSDTTGTTLDVPPCGASSSAISRNNVVFPAPLGLTSAMAEPSATRKDTSPSGARPSGR